MNNPSIVVDLEENIRQETAVNNADILQSVLASFEHRVQLWVDAGSDHSQNLVWLFSAPYAGTFIALCDHSQHVTTLSTLCDHSQFHRD